MKVIHLNINGMDATKRSRINSLVNDTRPDIIALGETKLKG